jgi:hypothetical protein
LAATPAPPPQSSAARPRVGREERREGKVERCVRERAAGCLGKATRGGRGRERGREGGREGAAGRTFTYPALKEAVCWLAVSCGMCVGREGRGEGECESM